MKSHTLRNPANNPPSPGGVQARWAVNDGRKFDSPANFVFEFSPCLADEIARALHTVRVTFYRKRIATVALKEQTESPRTQRGHGLVFDRAFNYRGRMTIQFRQGKRAPRVNTINRLRLCVHCNRA